MSEVLDDTSCIAPTTATIIEFIDALAPLEVDPLTLEDGRQVARLSRTSAGILDKIVNNEGKTAITATILTAITPGKMRTELYIIDPPEGTDQENSANWLQASKSLQSLGLSSVTLEAFLVERASVTTPVIGGTLPDRLVTHVTERRASQNPEGSVEFGIDDKELQVLTHDITSAVVSTV